MKKMSSELDEESKKLIAQIQEMERYMQHVSNEVGDEIIDYGDEEEIAKAIAGKNCECTICTDVMEEDIVLLNNCDHIYHKECMHRYLQAEIENSKCPLLCPDM